MENLLFNFLLIIVIFIDFSQGKVFKITKMECRSFDSSFSYYKTCKVEHLKSGRASLYVNQVILYKEPFDDIILSFGIFKISKNRRFQFLNETLDYCAFSRQLMASGVLGYVLGPLLSISNINATCPMQLKNLIVEGFTIDENTLKQIPIPLGLYMFQLHTTIMKKVKSAVQIYASRVEKYS